QTLPLQIGLALLTMIFTNARLIFPDGIRDGLEVVAEEGKIRAIREKTLARGKGTIDLYGNYLAPGFVDLHVHGAVGRDTMEASAEAFGSICDFHASGGTTSLLLTTATAPIDKLVEVLSGGHSDASDEDARVAFDHGMRSATHTFNCMSSARRRGVYRIGGLLEFALSEPQISCELIADGHHVSTTLMKMLYRAKGASGICLVTDATAGAGLPDGSQFSLFGSDCIVEDGVCLLADRSALAGSASRMIDLVRTMVRDVDLPLHEVVMMATGNPAQAVGLETKGRLAAGADADFVILSPELEVMRAFCIGEEIWSE